MMRPRLQTIPSSVRLQVVRALSPIILKSIMLHAADISPRMTPEAICEPLIFFHRFPPTYFRVHLQPRLRVSPQRPMDHDGL